jgi:putative transposase
MPGAFFHIYARTQSRIHWFTDEVKHEVVKIIADAVESSDVALNAFVVMNNHFHVLVQQGDAPLSSFMQPLMRRTALRAKATHGLDDHLFGGRFQHRVCDGPRDLRNCIRYIHKNPIEAACCEDPADYPWSSHRFYTTSLDSSKFLPRLTVIRDLFARRGERSESELSRDYLSYISAGNPEEREFADRCCRAGNAYGAQLFNSGRNRTLRHPRTRKDLRDVIRDGIREICPELDLEIVRSFRGVQFKLIRQELVRRGAQHGYRGCEIARYLQMSESQVSRIIRTLPMGQRIPAKLRRG